MSEADLLRADLIGADLTGANLTGARVDSVIWNIRTTLWPEVVAARVLSGSDEVGPDVYRVRGGSSPHHSVVLV
jgi:uncharacterized protein YjbI with pentapeptide repeats